MTKDQAIDALIGHIKILYGNNAGEATYKQLEEIRECLKKVNK